MNFDLSTSTSPWYQAPITPSNTVDFDIPTQGIYVGGAGDVSVVRHDGTAVLFVGVPAGSVLPVVARRVGVSGTSASGLVGLWGVELGPVWSGSAFSPLDLSPVLWLDASDTSTITESGGAVSQWDDKSGNGNDVTNAVAASQPTSGTRTLNGLNVLDFDGSDVLRKASFTTTSPYTFITVTDVDASSGARYIVSSNVAEVILYLNASNQIALYNNTVALPGSATTFAQELIIGTFNGSSSFIRRNGASYATGTTGTLGMTTLSIGARSDSAANGPFNGGIAEIIVVDGTLTAGEIAATESYLAQKWGITL